MYDDNNKKIKDYGLVNFQQSKKPKPTFVDNLKSIASSFFWTDVGMMLIYFLCLDGKVTHYEVMIGFIVCTLLTSVIFIVSALAIWKNKK